MRKIVLALALGLALVWSAAAAAKECKPVSGTFEATTVACPAPFCTAGTLTGDLNATYAFTMTAATQTGPIQTFQGSSTIVAEKGELYGADTGWINSANGTFETTVNITGGTGKYAGASGQLVATGTLTATGTAGTYTGMLCKGKKGDDD